MEELPSAVELAVIAAPLAIGKSPTEYSAVAKSAIQLWESCLIERENHRPKSSRADLLKEALLKDEQLFGKEEKENYTLKELLKQAFPKARTLTERRSRFLAFLKFHLRIVEANKRDLNFEDTPEIEIEDRIRFLEKINESGIDSENYKNYIIRINNWKELILKEKTSKAGKASAKKRKK